MPQRSLLSRTLTEWRRLLHLALPIMVAQLAQTAMGFVDTLMAGRVGPTDLAAVALGNSLWVPVFLLLTGILLATTPQVARLFGNDPRSPRIAPMVRQAIWLALALGLLAAAALSNALPLFLHMGVAPALAAQASAYLQPIALAMPVVAVYQVLRCYSDGLAHTRPAMLLGVLGLALNVPANYVFIYGKLGLPALGGVGCGWATALVMLVTLLGMLGWVAKARCYRHSRPFTRLEKPHWPEIRQLLRVGLPIGVAVFAEVSIFSVIALLIGELGATVVAGHQIALNFTSMAFMVPLAMGMAITVRVGQALGRNDPRAAAFSAGSGVAAGLLYAMLSASLILLLRVPIAHIYTQDPAVVELAGRLLTLAALFQFSDAIQITATGALRGYQDTRAIMRVTLFAYWVIGLPVGYALGLSDALGAASGPQGLWQGLVLGLTCAALLLGLRLRQRTQREIRRRG